MIEPICSDNSKVSMCVDILELYSLFIHSLWLKLFTYKIINIKYMSRVKRNEFENSSFKSSDDINKKLMGHTAVSAI